MAKMVTFEIIPHCPHLFPFYVSDQLLTFIRVPILFWGFPCLTLTDTSDTKIIPINFIIKLLNYPFSLYIFFVFFIRFLFYLFKCNTLFLMV